MLISPEPGRVVPCSESVQERHQVEHFGARVCVVQVRYAGCAAGREDRIFRATGCPNREFDIISVHVITLRDQPVLFLTAGCAKFFQSHEVLIEFPLPNVASAGKRHIREAGSAQ